MKPKRIPCPHCAELISSDAKKCPFCRSDLRQKSKMASFGKIIAIILGSLGLIFIACLVYLAYFVANTDNTYTGQELFDAVNAYRDNAGVKPLVIEPILCDGLGGRLSTIVEKKGVNTGFHDWLEQRGLEKDGQPISYERIGELATFKSPDEAIKEWVSSPGHKSALEHPELNVGCAYAYNGSGIVIVATKK